MITLYMIIRNIDFVVRQSRLRLQLHPHACESGILNVCKICFPWLTWSSCHTYDKPWEGLRRIPAAVVLQWENGIFNLACSPVWLYWKLVYECRYHFFFITPCMKTRFGQSTSSCLSFQSKWRPNRESLGAVPWFHVRGRHSVPIREC